MFGNTSSSRTAVRAAAVAACVSATAFASAGVAAAATATPPTVEGNTVSVTFSLDEGQWLDSCVAILSPTAKAPTIAERFSGGATLQGVLDSIKDPDIIALKTSFLNSPISAMTLLNRSSTMSAKDVPSNFYSLVTACFNGGKYKVNTTPVLLVGNPLEAAVGSVQTGSTQENLGALSTVISSGSQQPKATGS